MYFEINIAKDGSHFFATHERSITTSDKAKKLVELFKQKFTEKEGFAISVTYYPTPIGYGLDTKDFQKSLTLIDTL